MSPLLAQSGRVIALTDVRFRGQSGHRSNSTNVISVETDRTSRTGDSASGTRLPTMQITGGYTPRASHVRGCRCEKGYDRIEIGHNKQPSAAAPRRSAFGTKRKSRVHQLMSAFGGKADMTSTLELRVHALIGNAASETPATARTR